MGEGLSQEGPTVSCAVNYTYYNTKLECMPASDEIF